MNPIIDQTNNRTLPIILIIIIGFSLVMGLIGCSNKQTEWQNPKKLKKFWYKDIKKCRNLAEAQMARELDIGTNIDFIKKGDLQIQFENYDALKILNFYYIDCMIGAGYYRILKHN